MQEINLLNIATAIDKAYKKEEYPALFHQITNYKKEQPLRGLNILDATPVYRNTLIKHYALLASGANLTVGISDVITYDNKIVELLQSSGINVIHANSTPSNQDIILDCAAAFASWEPNIGVSELTHSGIETYEKTDRLVFLTDAGKIKRIETCVGTGESYFRAMEYLNFNEWKNKKIVIFGSGKVGTGIIFNALQKGCIVNVVTETNTVNPLLRDKINVIDISEREKINAIFDDAYAVVTATGVKDAVSSCCDIENLINSKALIANMGVKDEFGADFPEARALNNKHTLNFILEEPTSLKYIDATLALHNAGISFLMENKNLKGIFPPDSKIENEILDVTLKNGIIRDEIQFLLM